MLLNKKTKLNIFVLLATVAVSILVMGSDIVQAKIIYVDTNALGANNGTSWDDAFNHLQNALAAASFGSEIWVAQGVYKPDEDTVHPNGNGSRNRTFQLKNGVAIYGGFPAGGGEWHERDANDPNNETILSGDLNGDDGPDFTNNGENSYNVVTGSGTNATAVLDGFTITAGNADGYGDNSMGGGMTNWDGSRPTVTNCTFSGNCATESGGAMENINSSPTLTNCTFSDNSTPWAGGGVDNCCNSSPTLTNCTFSGNSAEVGGGMVNCDNSNPTLTNCTFSDNSAGYCGGGMINLEYSNPTVTNCTFSGNSANSEGGGMKNENSSPTLTNCAFSCNSSGGNGGGMDNFSSSPLLTNCTFTGNDAASFASGGGIFVNLGFPVFNDCNFTGNTAGYGGGISSVHSSSVVTNCTFEDNVATNLAGGLHMNNELGGHWILTDCTFSENKSYFDGGGVDNTFNDTEFTRCVFNGNSALWGGGMSNWESSPTLTDCTFSGNFAGDNGGGMSNSEYSSPTVTNCTFSGNSADVGGGIINWEYSNTTVTNCILWGNTAPGGSQINNHWTSWATVSYSDVQGGWPGIGNINADPMFMNADNDDLRLLPDSPCIDAGDNTAVPVGIIIDLEGNPRFVDQPEVPDTGNGIAPIVDMGAFEANYIKVPMKFTPQSLNPGSKGNWIKAHFVLPEGFYVEDVDADMPAIIPFLGIEAENMNVFINEDGLVEIEAAFNRSNFCGAVISDEPIEVTVIGQLNTGQKFHGTDAIRITNNFIKYLAVFSSYWLQTDCDELQWCDGADLNQDSVVNFIDFALFDSCCVVGE